MNGYNLIWVWIYIILKGYLGNLVDDDDDGDDDEDDDGHDHDIYHNNDEFFKL